MIEQLNTSKNSPNVPNISDPISSHTNNTPPSPIKNNYSNNLQSFNFGSYNIRGKFKETYHEIIQKIDSFNLDICFICDTNSKAIYKNTTNYKYHITQTPFSPKNTIYYIIHSADETQKSGSGVAFIIHQNLYKHISKITTLPGRCINIQFAFKKTFKRQNFHNITQVTGIYLHSYTKDRSDTFNAC